MRLADTKQWKAVSHPTRLAILRQLDSGERTNEELAKALGIVSGKLHYHTKRLLEAGLIEHSGVRRKGVLTEKPYRRVPGGYEIPIQEDGTVPPLYPMLQHGLAMYRETWETVEKGEFPQLGYNFVIAVTEEIERQLFDDLKAVYERMVSYQDDPDARGPKKVALTALIHRVSAPLVPDRQRG